MICTKEGRIWKPLQPIIKVSTAASKYYMVQPLTKRSLTTHFLAPLLLKSADFSGGREDRPRSLYASWRYSRHPADFCEYRTGRDGHIQLHRAGGQHRQCTAFISILIRGRNKEYRIHAGLSAAGRRSFIESPSYQLLGGSLLTPNSSPGMAKSLLWQGCSLDQSTLEGYQLN